MDKHDIVYILRNDIDSDEIRYSLRSVEKYFPHGKVWFYGGKPAGIEPDEYVKVIQQGASKYAKVTNTLSAVVKKLISERLVRLSDPEHPHSQNQALILT